VEKIKKFNQDKNWYVRFIAIRAERELDWDKTTVIMDLTTVKRDIDWPRFLYADDFNFVHDLVGINKHLDRATGEFKDGFLPKFAVNQ
jgi:hypothetical protein